MTTKKTKRQKPETELRKLIRKVMLGKTSKQVHLPDASGQLSGENLKREVFKHWQGEEEHFWHTVDALKKEGKLTWSSFHVPIYQRYKQGGFLRWKDKRWLPAFYPQEFRFLAAAAILIAECNDGSLFPDSINSLLRKPLSSKSVERIKDALLKRGVLKEEAASGYVLTVSRVAVHDDAYVGSICRARDLNNPVENLDVLNPGALDLPDTVSKSFPDIWSPLQTLYSLDKEGEAGSNEAQRLLKKIADDLAIFEDLEKSPPMLRTYDQLPPTVQRKLDGEALDGFPTRVQLMAKRYGHETFGDLLRKETRETLLAKERIGEGSVMEIEAILALHENRLRLSGQL